VEGKNTNIHSKHSFIFVFPLQAGTCRASAPSSLCTSLFAPTSGRRGGRWDPSPLPPLVSSQFESSVNCSVVDPDPHKSAFIFGLPLVSSQFRSSLHCSVVVRISINSLSFWAAVDELTIQILTLLQMFCIRISINSLSFWAAVDELTIQILTLLFCFGSGSA
jgi:hypothetical protein